jgi:hypothetical protein
MKYLHRSTCLSSALKVKCIYENDYKDIPVYRTSIWHELSEDKL